MPNLLEPCAVKVARTVLRGGGKLAPLPDYHLRQRAYVVIELKTTEFKPEYAGKMNFYLSAVDDLLRHEQDGSSIGIILCKTKNKVVAEYALRDTQKPIGVSSFQLTESLPEKLQGSLPTIKELEAKLSTLQTKGTNH